MVVEGLSPVEAGYDSLLRAVEELFRVVTDLRQRVELLELEFKGLQSIRAEGSSSKSPSVSSRRGRRSWKGVNRDLVLEALRKAEGIRSRAAELLGISLPGLYYHMKRFGIIYPRGRSGKVVSLLGRRFLNGTYEERSDL